MLTVASSEQDVAQPASDIVDRDAMTTAGFNRRYWKWASDIEALFGKLKTNKETEFEMIEEVARDIIDCYYQDGRYCLNLMNLRHPPASERYLSTHAINTAIAAAGIGARRAYPLPLVRELVVGALLHDIGHLLTYRPFLAKRDLDSPEQQKYDQHVTVGMAMLKNIAKIPVSTMLVVAQHGFHIFITADIPILGIVKPPDWVFITQPYINRIRVLLELNCKRIELHTRIITQAVIFTIRVSWSYITNILIIF